ncbi:MAG: TIGR01459 family HAD-type hydrolase [Phenylobacterium sp.]|uniref:TIGR01459 family HAD-type hydrolase n=1 Tax=Phenylobacterium sp. TaxID=1871053 RepID=UPI0027187CCA|nr:TIGR01459 family HAD-type hydrolase [Phenylobacterium sp.]MDO8901188.1 TIGR01459 family HAD-type hydrolase [Phenylobacterium sp.]
MTKPQTPQGLSDLIDHYDVLLSDVWGVIHNGRESFPAACAALARWRAERGPVILISNSPRPSHDVVAQLDALGVPRESWSAFVTSGDATRLLLAERAPGPAWRLGPDRDAPLYEGLGLSFEALDKAAFIACTGPIDDETEGPGDYQDRFEGAAARGLEMVCANPDIVVQRGDKLIYCGGALAQLYETLGGKVVMAGKPHAPIYDLCVAEAARLTGRPVDRARLLCIGDGVATDVKGANAQGLDVLFIAAGIHGAETITPEGLDAAAVEALLRQAGAQARWAMADLAW